MIVVCGEALIDMISSADGTQHAMAGGGPFNTARALARLGVPAAFLGRLSGDRFGRELASLLVADGVSLEMASIGPEPTTIALADVNADGFAEYRFVIEGTSAPNLTLDMLPERLAQDVTALHIGTLGLTLEPIASTLVELVRRERDGRLVMLDPNIRAGLAGEGEYRERVLSLIAQSTIVKASEGDLDWLYPDRDYRVAADQVLDAGARLAVVTLGAEGAYGTHRDLRVQVTAPAVDVVDTVGAGDAFGAALLAWLHDHGAVRPELSLDGDQLQAALDYACLAASITCRRGGADPPWKRELSGEAQSGT